jgi:hypothetical protein
MEEPDLRALIKIIVDRAKPHLDRFGIWFNQQEGVVKAAAIALIGTLITGCFLLVAAVISRPAPTPAIIITATLSAQPTPVASATETRAPTLTSTPSSTSAAASLGPTAGSDFNSATPPATSKDQWVNVPPTPALEWLGSLAVDLPVEMTSIAFSVLGGFFLVFGLWLAWVVALRRTESDTVISIILLAIILFAAWQKWGWLPILISLGSLGLVPLLVFGILWITLTVPYFGPAVAMATVCFFVGLGGILLYLAIPGPFLPQYIEFASLVGIAIGAVFGLILSSLHGGSLQGD